MNKNALVPSLFLPDCCALSSDVATYGGSVAKSTLAHSLNSRSTYSGCIRCSKLSAPKLLIIKLLYFRKLSASVEKIPSAGDIRYNAHPMPQPTFKTQPSPS